MTETKILPIPCPECKGEVEQTYFSADCRGNPAVTSIYCKKCGQEFSVEEWANIEIAAAGQLAKNVERKKGKARRTYSIWKSGKGKKVIRYQLLGVGDGSVPYDVIEKIIRREFPHVPRKLIKFSIDSDALYFGNDLP